MHFTMRNDTYLGKSFLLKFVVGSYISLHCLSGCFKNCNIYSCYFYFDAVANFQWCLKIFIILQFNISKIWHKSHWAKIKVFAGLNSLWENRFSCLFSRLPALLDSCLFSLPVYPALISGWVLSSSTLPLCPSFCFKGLSWLHRASQVTQDDLSKLISLDDQTSFSFAM